MALAGASGSAEGTRSPLTLSSTTSGIPPARRATLGQPKNMASRMLRQKLSVSEVNSPKSAACKIIFDVGDFFPTITRSLNPNRRTSWRTGRNRRPPGSRA